jgi:hypothetical protein
MKKAKGPNLLTQLNCGDLTPMPQMRGSVKSMAVVKQPVSDLPEKTWLNMPISSLVQKGQGAAAGQAWDVLWAQKT